MVPLLPPGLSFYFLLGDAWLEESTAQVTQCGAERGWPEGWESLPPTPPRPQ